MERQEKLLKEQSEHKVLDPLLQNIAISEILGVLLKVVDIRDRYVKEHSIRVMQYALQLATRIDLSEARLEEIQIGGLLHDLGKIGISESIMNKEEKLTINEFEKIKEHPRIGHQIIAEIQIDERVKEMVLYHHERWDGTGYPRGLAGEEIPLLARIVAIADAFDAMTSIRVYRRKAMTWAEALAEVEKCSGTQFDPNLSHIFIEMMREEVQAESDIA